jgi:class 3 adenylate cyclase/tetratricopeptide (TPR) repeat protein
MNCLRCRTNNLPDSLFCIECGAKIEVGCSVCGAGNPPAAKFCRKCGHALAAVPSLTAYTPKHLAEKIAAEVDGPQSRVDSPRSYTPRHLAEKILNSRAALEGERKQVTVLFADVKGSMDLTEAIDPEVWHRIMDRFFAILSQGVHRFEGTVNQYTGDGVMALFGAPLAHEDHARRGCYAAMHLTEALRRYGTELRLERGLNFSVRMGLNSGEVVVGKIGDDLRMDYTAQGHTVGLAARMEQLAEPGKVFLTEHTAKLVSGYFTLNDLGVMKVKGLSEPMHVYELAGLGTLRTRFDLSRTRGLSPFVGRKQEMNVLEDALSKVLEGHGQVVGIVAEAGTGKSRLCYEFADRCRRRGLEVIVASGVPHGKAVPFLAVREILRRLCGAAEHDAAEEARRKIAGALLLRDETFKADLPLLFDFLGVPDPEWPAPRMDPEALQRQLFSVVRRLIQTRRYGTTAVLLFEDVHWIDSASEAGLESLVEAVPTTRTLLLVNFRPEYRATWMGKSYYQQLALVPLDSDAIGELLRELLGIDPSVTGLAERIREQAAGNPFFVEEMVQALAEAGGLQGVKGSYRAIARTTELPLPETVQALLAARIDRLSEVEKDVLQTAAVIGQQFTESVLQQVTEHPRSEAEAALSALLAGEFLFEVALYPETVYAFKHPLTQEVAYRSQLSERRTRVHAAVARAIEELYADRLDDNAALLADHWERAGDALTAANWHQRAAMWAGVRDRGTMLRHWQRIRALLASVPESSDTLALRLLARIQILHNALFTGQPSDETSALITEGKELAERLGDPTMRLWLLGDSSMTKLSAGAVDEGLAYAMEGMRIARDSGDAGAQLAIRFPAIFGLRLAGRLKEALQIAEEADALSADDPAAGAEITGFRPYGAVLVLRASLRTYLGDLARAAQDLDRAAGVARDQKDDEVLTMVEIEGVSFAQFMGDPQAALTHGQRAVERATATASEMLRAEALGALGRANLLHNLWNEAIEAETAALRIMREHRAGRFAEIPYLITLGQAYLGSRDPDRARETIDLALDLTQRHRTRLFQIIALLARARIELATDGVASAAESRRILDEAMEVAQATGAHSCAPLIHIERAKLADVCGDATESRRERAEARRLFEAMGATEHVRRLANEVASS